MTWTGRANRLNCLDLEWLRPKLQGFLHWLYCIDFCHALCWTNRLCTHDYFIVSAFPMRQKERQLHFHTDSNTFLLNSFQIVYICVSAHVSPKVILPLIISGLFFISVRAAIGRPQFATGPQKCCHTQTHCYTVMTENLLSLIKQGQYEVMTLCEVKQIIYNVDYVTMRLDKAQYKYLQCCWLEFLHKERHRKEEKCVSCASDKPKSTFTMHL